MKKQILKWLLKNYQHKEFVLTITRLLHDKNVDLVYIINYYLSHLKQEVFGPQHDCNVYKDLFVKTIQYYGGEWDMDYVDSDECDFDYIVKLMKDYDSELYYDANKNKFKKKKKKKTYGIQIKMS